MAKRPKTPKPPPAVSEQILKELAATALRKRSRGEKPTAQELGALRKVEKQREEELRWHHYETVPKKHYLEMAGDGDSPRPRKVIHEQADRYGLPLRGPTINFRDFIRAVHDFLAANKRKLAEPEPDSDEALFAGRYSPAQERWREAKAEMAEIQLAREKKRVLSREDLRNGLNEISAILRGIGEGLQRQFGPDALQLHDEGLDDAQAAIDRMFLKHGLNEEDATEGPAA